MQRLLVRATSRVEDDALQVLLRPDDSEAVEWRIERNPLGDRVRDRRIIGLMTNRRRMRTGQ